LCEASALVSRLRMILRERASLEGLETYNRERQEAWQQLLGLTGGLKPRADTDYWVTQRRAKILPCLPGSEADLSGLAAQLRLDV